MNYIELINHFWKKDIEYNFCDKEITLYFYLLKVSNSIGWKNPFGLSNDMTVAKFRWGKSSFDTCKNRLKMAGLIDFNPGNGRGNVYQYTIIDTTKVLIKGTQSDALSHILYPHLSDTLSEQKPATSININKTKDSDNNTPVNFFTVSGQKILEVTPFEYYRKECTVELEANCMNYKISIEEIKRQHEIEYITYDFKDLNHLKKSVVFVIKALKNQVKPGKGSSTVYKECQTNWEDNGNG